MKSAEKLLKVDGHNLYFQMFFGMPARIVNNEGVAYQCVLGFVGALIRIIKMTEPTHAVALFDGEHENSRARMLPEYKANRPDYSRLPEAENPFSQLPGVYAALDYLGIARHEAEELEADDIIAGYAHTYADRLHIVVISTDSDFFQLISNGLSVLRYRGVRTVVCDEAYVRGRYGIEPGQYAEFKALVGDHADNIKGAERIGIKTAASLLRRFSTLRGILDNAESITQPSIRASVLRNRERLTLNRELIKLGGRPALPYRLEELAYAYNNMTTAEVLKGLGLK